MTHDDVANLCISTYLILPKSFHPAPRSNGVPQYCILAGFVLELDDRLSCVTLATGSKCLNESNMDRDGRMLHDSHAEVLARRGLRKWLYDEIIRCASPGYQSDWLDAVQEKPVRLRAGVKIHMYVSTLPCKALPCDANRGNLHIWCQAATHRVYR